MLADKVKLSAKDILEKMNLKQALEVTDKKTLTNF